LFVYNKGIIAYTASSAAGKIRSTFITTALAACETLYTAKGTGRES